VEQTQSVIATVLYSVGMLLAVFASAGLVSAMFEPGRIELLLSKPVSRVHLLLGRYAGNVLVVSANILYLVAGSWIVFGIKTGVWGAGFLLSSLCTVFVFSVLLAVIVLVGALWDSAAVAIMVTFAIMIVTTFLGQIFPGADIDH
jgi:ABC-type transport system involved in multi-copper enzyme maturation permease subunit